MNWDRLGLNRRPFRAAPSLDLFVPLPSHEAALAALRSAFDAGDGIAILDGGPGTGKSLVALRFLESLGRDVLPIYVPAARFSKASDLHQTILFDLGQDYRGLSDHELRLALADHYLKALAESKRGVLVLDEAQHLTAELLEEVRLLDNWDARGTKAVFTVLVAQPDLRDRFQRADCELLAGRVNCRVRLDALALEESRTFLKSQLEMCGRSSGEPASDEALDLFARYGRGNPRFLNRLASTALDLAFEAGADGVDIEAAYEAATRAGIELEEAAEPSQPASPADAAKSKAGAVREAGEGRESAEVRPPKQKARTRRAA